MAAASYCHPFAIQLNRARTQMEEFHPLLEDALALQQRLAEQRNMKLQDLHADTTADLCESIFHAFAEAALAAGNILLDLDVVERMLEFAERRYPDRRSAIMYPLCQLDEFVGLALRWAWLTPGKSTLFQQLSSTRSRIRARMQRLDVCSQPGTL